MTWHILKFINWLNINIQDHVPTKTCMTGNNLVVHKALNHVQFCILYRANKSQTFMENRRGYKTWKIDIVIKRLQMNNVEISTQIVCQKENICQGWNKWNNPYARLTRPRRPTELSMCRVGGNLESPAHIDISRHQRVSETMDSVFQVMYVQDDVL